MYNHNQMKSFLPYNISHIYLERQEELHVPDTKNKGNYIVFWWKEIALGDIYVEPNERLSEEEYLNKIYAAIYSTIIFYSEKSDGLATPSKEWFNKSNIHDLSQLLELIFNKDVSENIPAKVPVSVVICTRNRAASLLNCLNLLRKLTCRPEEIVVVDNAPDDDTTLKIARQFEEVVYVREPKKGLGIARNTGLSKATCPVIAFTDDDVLVHHLWIYRLWKSFEDQSVAAMTGLVIAADLKTESQYIFEKYWSFNRGYVEKIYDSSFLKTTMEKGPPVWDIGAGANMAFRKSVFDETGGFRELLGAGAAGCNEDSEMWYRILVEGYKVLYEPTAIAYHEHRKETKNLKSQIYYYMRGHAAAALLQHKLHPESGYKQRIFKEFPTYYFTLLLRGFPRYNYRYSTLWNEIKGVISGVAFYYRNLNWKANSSPK